MFLVFVITFFIGYGIIMVALFLPFYSLFGDAADYMFYLMQTASALVIVPLFSSFTTVLYLDLRVRKEGLDEGTLAAELSM